MPDSTDDLGQSEARRMSSINSPGGFSKEPGVFAGALLADQPSYCTSPPIEVVVFGWGVTEDGQLGLDSNEDVNKPSVLESLLGTSFSGFRYNRKPIVAGSRHTLAVTEDGRILAWGWNDRGSLGLGHRSTTPKPAVVRGLEHEHIVQVAAGGWHCLAVTKAGTMYAWGGNEYFQCGVDAGKRDLTIPKPTVPFLKVSMVSCGGMHSVALTTTGEVWQWGEPWGDFSIDVNRSPRKLAASQIVSITSGAFHNLALNSSNQVLSWGTNDFGQLGTGDTTYATEPRLVVGLDKINVADISAGGWHSLVLSANGEVFTWGRGEYGRLGLNDPKGVSRVRPCLVPGLKGHRVIQAMCGGSHTMALTDQGHIFTWGRCTNGRQGFNAQATVQLPHQIHMPGGSERWHPICIAAGGRHSMCMALPRQTVTDHARRLTAQSESSSWLGRVSDMFTPQSTPILIKSPSLRHRRSNSQGQMYLSQSAGQVTSSATATGQHADQHMVYTVPANRQAFMRESTTTDGGETLGSSTSGQGVSGHSSMGQDAPPAMAGIMAQATFAVPAHEESRGASFDVLARQAGAEPPRDDALQTDIEFPSSGPHADQDGVIDDNTPRLGRSREQSSADSSQNMAAEATQVGSQVETDDHGGVYVTRAETTVDPQSDEMSDERLSQLHLSEQESEGA